MWCPQPGPQSAAYLSDAKEVFFGGAVGGGKSDFILGAALTAHVRSLILRNEGSQLEGFKMRLGQLQRPGDNWKGIGIHGGVYTTVDGRTIELNGCDALMTANKKFRGRPHDLKAWDELPTIPKSVYTFINAWNRTDIPGQQWRSIATGNPPTTAEEEWVLDYWGPWLREGKAIPGELLWYAPVGKGDEIVQVEDGSPIILPGYPDPIVPLSRTFIPSTLDDNPIYIATGYRSRVQGIDDPVLRKQLMSGDMQAGLQDHPNQVIPSAWIDAAMQRWTERIPGDKRFMTAMGIDPARGGKDRFTIAKRYENWVAPLVQIPGKLVPNGKLGASRVMMEMDYPHTLLVIDITGTAGGDLYGSLTAHNPHVHVHAFVASARSEYRDRTGTLKMRNKRTEAYWRLRDLLDPSNDVKMALPQSQQLKIELATQRGYLYVDGMGLDDKDEVTKRLSGKSPDLADAVAMSIMDVDAFGGWGATSASPGVMVDDFMGTQLPKNPEDYQQKQRTGPTFLDWN